MRILNIFLIESTISKQIDWKQLQAWKMKSRFLSHSIIISRDSTCNVFSMIGTIKNKAWIREKKESSFYLVMKKIEMQWFFEGYSSKQMALMLWNDGILKLFGSATLENFQNSTRHCKSLKKNRTNPSLPVGILHLEWACNDDGWWRKQRKTRVLLRIWQKFAKCEDVDWERMQVFSVWRLWF